MSITRVPEDSELSSGMKGSYAVRHRFFEPFLRFKKGTDGAILVLFAFMIIPLLLFVGFAMELALIEKDRIKLQNTTDSASLAAADLEQALEPEAVVADFFQKAGLESSLQDVVIRNTGDEKTVVVTAEVQFPALLSRVAGLRTWIVPVAGAATESRGDIEIAVALDNSGSMSWAPGSIGGPAANPSRMDLLIPAAEAFVDAVQPKPGDPGSTTISLVPFATQVSVGEGLLSHFSVTSEHNASHCVTFNSNADFGTTTVPTETLLSRTAHHDPSGTGWSVSQNNTVCPTNPDRRDIYAWSENPVLLKNRIRAMEPNGYTSIEMAAKWGAALLDPSLRPVLSSMSESGFDYMAGPAGRGMPYDFNDPEAIKFLIVMSDGENTQNFDIKAPYREGLSPLYRLSGSNNYSYYLDRRGSNRDYYRVSDRRWRSNPGSGARQLTWPEVWADMPVWTFVNNILSRADRSHSTNYFYNQIVESKGSSWKNDRTSEICKAAKDNDIIVFTIGMDTYGQGDATLADCASSPSHFYDINGLDVASAFASIARQINQLRLTQ